MFGLWRTRHWMATNWIFRANNLGPTEELAAAIFRPIEVSSLPTTFHDADLFAVVAHSQHYLDFCHSFYQICSRWEDEWYFEVNCVGFRWFSWKNGAKKIFLVMNCSMLKCVLLHFIFLSSIKSWTTAHCNRITSFFLRIIFRICAVWFGFLLTSNQNLIQLNRVVSCRCCEQRKRIAQSNARCHLISNTWHSCKWNWHHLRSYC